MRAAFVSVRLTALTVAAVHAKMEKTTANFILCDRGDEGFFSRKVMKEQSKDWMEEFLRNFRPRRGFYNEPVRAGFFDTRK
jgi:hypothetical protein